MAKYPTYSFSKKLMYSRRLSRRLEDAAVVGLNAECHKIIAFLQKGEQTRVKGLIKATRIRLVPTLNTRGILASATAGFVPNAFSRSPNSRRRGRKMTPPPTLKMKWLRAVLLAARSMFNIAINAVAVVPIRAPMMSGTAFSRLNRPCCKKMDRQPYRDCTRLHRSRKKTAHQNGDERILRPHEVIG